MSMAENKALRKHWWVIYGVVLTVLAYNLICHYFDAQIQYDIGDDKRVLIRTLLYIAAIALLPLTNLLRFVLIRLNQTMPGDKTAEERYFTTIVSTQLVIELIASFGLIMFILGDGDNTLYIFSVMALLGAGLHRPKQQDLDSIKAALQTPNHVPKGRR